MKISNNWKIKKNGDNEKQENDEEILKKYIISFINDDDELITPNEPIELNKNECQESFQIDIEISKTNLYYVQSIYIESNSRTQEFFIIDQNQNNNNSNSNEFNYIGTQKSFLIENSNPKLFSTEYSPDKSILSSNISIKFLSLLNKDSILISKIILDLKESNILIKRPIINSDINQSKQTPSPNDVGNLLSLMSMLKIPASSGDSSGFDKQKLPPPQTIFPNINQQLPIPQNIPHPQNQPINNNSNNNINNELILKTIIASENRMMNFMENKFQLIFNKIDDLEKKINTINNNNINNNNINNTNNINNINNNNIENVNNE